MDNFIHSSGVRILIKWDSTYLYFDALLTYDQFIHGLVTLGNSIIFLLTIVYGFNDPHDRIHLWNNLNGITNTINLSWQVLEDFNVIL